MIFAKLVINRWG